MFRRAEGAIGSMVLLIAVLITASIGAAVIIHNSAGLQQKALNVGASSMHQISTSLMVYTIQAVDGPIIIENLTLTVKLNIGSDPVNITKVLVRIQTKNTTTTYTYGPAVLVDPVNQNGTFTVKYLEHDPNYQDGLLLRGDLVELHLRTARALLKDESVRILFIPAGGLSTTAGFYMPSVLTTNHLMLYP